MFRRPCRRRSTARLLRSTVSLCEYLVDLSDHFFRRDPVFLPVYGTDQVADVTGAGDTVIATFTLGLAAGASYAEAAKLANYAGGIVVMKMGTATVSNEELRHAIERDEELN
jgi:bifunctional ADP-heptose synthase (sugar kinase/adenylyltransferase)